MASTTVTGRVRATVRLKDDGAAGGVGTARVVTTSWASDRAFPRTQGTGVVFELQTGDGEIVRVDPFEALVTLPVRSRAQCEGVWHEEGWIAAEDEITIEGDLERAGRGRQPPALRARRITLAGAPQHRLPPRSLQRGDSEKLEAVVAPVTMVTVSSVPAEEVVAPAADTAATVADPAAPISGAPTEATETGAEPSAARRPKKKRPDSSGTPTPIQ